MNSFRPIGAFYSWNVTKHINVSVFTKKRSWVKPRYHNSAWVFSIDAGPFHFGYLKGKV